MTTKICSTCKTEKRITEFYKKASTSDGHQGRCITCQRASREAAIGSGKAPQTFVIEKTLPNTAGPRTHTNSSIYEPYRPSDERAVYRNDGHKHILSRGF